MDVFPQLSSGAVSQFPHAVTTSYRTLLNRALDGSEIYATDVDFHTRRWELDLDQLSDQEWQSILDLCRFSQNGRADAPR